MRNPIIENRLVSDYTFATRFLQFLSEFYPDCGSWHPMLEEEYEYMCIVAKELLDYQKSTVENENERKYFDNLKENTSNPEFERYLKMITHGK